MVLMINGIPLVTMELKNQFTGQSVENGKNQYIDMIMANAISLEASDIFDTNRKKYGWINILAMLNM